MRCVVSWSGGKDCCVALHELRASRTYEVAGLLTTVVQDDGRISMHRVSGALLRRQAHSLGLPLIEVPIPANCTNATYEAALAAAFSELRSKGVEAVAFGDLFLEDIRRYRDDLVTRNGLTSVYPVWGRDTRSFLETFVASGFEAVTCCIDLSVLHPSFAGRMVDRDFLAELPRGVDPCGENGEFHTFVANGPGFTAGVPLSIGPRIEREGFAYCELGLRTDPVRSELP